jgi:hypothetical protein
VKTQVMIGIGGVDPDVVALIETTEEQDAHLVRDRLQDPRVGD